jgi:hypothetical protein
VLVLDLPDPQHALLVPAPADTEKERRQSDRYEPMPGVAELPAWLWRRMGRGGRIGALVALIVALGIAAALLPGILESKEERAQDERRERAEQRAERVRRLEAEQRPRVRRSASVAPPGAAAAERLEARAALMEELPAEILSDARARARSGQLDGPIDRVQCQPFPRTVDGIGAEEDLARRTGRYSCVAVTADFGTGEAGATGVIGHQYRAEVDFEAGRYAFCKVSGQAGPSREQLVTTPKACGG